MQKEEIQEIIKTHLYGKWDNESIRELAKSSKKFLSSLKSLDEYQIKKVLAINPQYSNAWVEGWHSLHYAALKNDPEIMKIFFNYAIENGLSEMPKTQVEKRGSFKNMGLLNFCAKLDLDKSFAITISSLKNFENHDYTVNLRYAFLYNGVNTLGLIKKLFPNYEKEMFKFYNDDKSENAYGASKENVYKILIKNFKYDPKKFEDLSINIKHREPDCYNYFTSTLKMMESFSYEIDKEGFDKFKKTINFFLEKGFTLDETDGLGQSPRDFLLKIGKYLDGSLMGNQLKKEWPNFEKKSLENQLKTNQKIDGKKLKI